jgi:hypothetical protein
MKALQEYRRTFVVYLSFAAFLVAEVVLIGYLYKFLGVF